MGTIASCGHKLSEGEEIVTVLSGGEDCDAIDGFMPCIFYMSYCPACAEKAKAWPTYFATEALADAWFDAQIVSRRSPSGDRKT